ncbi:hypothetical protein ES703_87107 [subsurface metagenome]
MDSLSLISSRVFITLWVFNTPSLVISQPLRILCSAAHLLKAPLNDSIPLKGKVAAKKLFVISAYVRNTRTSSLSSTFSSVAVIAATDGFIDKKYFLAPIDKLAKANVRTHRIKTMSQSGLRIIAFTMEAGTPRNTRTTIPMK